ncbi:hypothetical protein WJS89_11085 [Sphingomicrobium sp. XHP0235]|uniref:hypothetical protein n=1 Tax=Sphingomicrobium aquimarinum TaxID=3133971 RepID=UPI0031FED00F
MKTFLFPVALLLSLAACDTSDSDVETQSDPTNDAVENSGVSEGDADASSEARAEPGTMPLAMRGTYAEAAVGDPDPSGQACDPAYAFDKVITIREDGYSLFETGGRIVEVDTQSRNSIFATFDTTYADTPTSARERFAVSDEGRTLRRSIVGGANDGTIRYRRCPDA